MLKFLWNNKFTILLWIACVAVFILMGINIMNQDIYIGLLYVTLPAVFVLARMERGR